VPNADELASQGALENLYLVPDYLSDLNAMHKAAEKYCKENKLYLTMSFINGRWGCGIYRHRFTVRECVDEIAHVYGTQLCPTLAETFLKTLGLWKEGTL